MNITYINKVDSTHSYLKECLDNDISKIPLCIYTDFQTNGIGSRNNTWKGIRGNLFFSFALNKEQLPQDLPVQSFSLYFSFILKKELEKLGSKIWIKWPNDFYINKLKLGGTITNIKSGYVMCGIGLNLLDVSEEFGSLDIEIDSLKLLQNYFTILEQFPSWKQVFREFSIEFHKNKSFTTTLDNKKIPLDHAILNQDGSITIDGQKVYSLR